MLIGIGFVLCSTLLGASILLAARAFSEKVVLMLASVATGLALGISLTFAAASAFGEEGVQQALDRRT